ncbi:hypothetical protein D3C76_949340 [compost metagenome]
MTEVFEDAAVIDNETIVLAFRNTVRASDGLHERMGLQRLVEIERGQSRYVKAGQPHGANDSHTEGML